MSKNVSGKDGFQSQFCALASGSCLRLSAFGLARRPCFEGPVIAVCYQTRVSCEIVGCQKENL